MGFEDFERKIKSPALKSVAGHWQQTRGSRLVPAWNDIRPSVIAGQLSMIWSYTYDAQADKFTGRLAGVGIEQKFGKSFRGTPMIDLYPPEDYQRLFERAKRVVCGPALYHGEGMVFRHLKQSGYGERIMLPVGADGVHGDGLLGATDYQFVYGGFNPDQLETETWFDL
ncbi:MAG: PAS domain-containing protein [Alphaproteobacteria bacterium]|nr:PAS domain-containing protein [Alphaproteobacteria bacterium]